MCFLGCLCRLLPLACRIHDAIVVRVQVTLCALQPFDGITLWPRPLLLDAKATHPSAFPLIGMLDIVAELIYPLTHLAVSLRQGPAFVELKESLIVFFCTFWNGCG